MALRPTRDPLRPPEAPGLGRGIGFALLVHIALVVAISINVQWRTKTLPAFEAELWSAVPQAAAPKAVEPEPEPEPPKPEPKPEPPQPKGPTPEEIQAQRDAEIAISKAKKLEEQKKAAAALLEEQKKQKLLKEKQEKQEKAERDKQDKLEKEKQDKLDKAKQDKLDKASAAKLEAQRQENLRRMMGMAGASGGPTSTGTAAKSSGPSSSYGGRIVARVRPNIIYSDSPAGNPVAEVEVRAAPSGDIIGKRLLKSSGDPEWDKAVLRAIDKTEKLPTDVDGSVPSSIVISFKYRD